jgi:hypothetical protein
MEKMEQLKPTDIPSTAACKICKYRMTDYCPDCLDEKLPAFEPKNIPLALLRVFTMDEYNELPNGIKGKLLAYYIIRIMEALNGLDHRETSDGNGSGKTAQD